MELYTNSAQRTVTLEVPVVPINGSLNVTVFDTTGALVHTVNTVTAGTGTLSFTMPFSFVQNGNEYRVRWEFNYLEDATQYAFYTETYVEVVRSILPLSEIAVILGVNYNTDDAMSVERAVRHVIQAHTGQKFDYSRKTLTVEGHGESALRLPERLVELEGLSTLSATLNTHRAIITSDGWYLKKGWTNEVTVLTTTDEFFTGDYISNFAAPGEPGFEMSDHGPVIMAPGATGIATQFRNDYPFRIAGWWGYRYVPAAIKEAAKLLVNDYGCQEALYRDRYLESIKAADWRLQFSSRAWESTGNARADYLLSEYVLADWAVI